MNERIRDLQIQAFAECKTFEDDKIRTDEVFERFAELIVRECARIIMNGGYWTDILGNRKNASPDEIAQMIKEHLQHHFGPWRQFGDTDSTLPHRMHTFTCPANRSDHADECGVLVPTVRGWICPFCDYTQDWAHDFMKNGVKE